MTKQLFGVTAVISLLVCTIFSRKRSTVYIKVNRKVLDEVIR